MENALLESNLETDAPYGFSCNAEFDWFTLQKRATIFYYSNCESDVVTLPDDSDEGTGEIKEGDDEIEVEDEDFEDDEALYSYDYDCIDDDVMSWDSLFEAVDLQYSRHQRVRNGTRKWMLTASNS